MNDKELWKAIDLAFANTQRPNSENISISVGPEGQEVKLFFANKNWQEITLDTLKNDYKGPHSACLGFMTPEAFAYYFPAYLKIATFSYDEGDVLSTTVTSMVFDAAEDVKCNTTDGVNLFTHEQNRVVAEALNKISKENEIEHGEYYADYFNYATKALKLRWGKYLNNK
jgi:hypothetical protein